jgi:spore germination protein
MIMNKSFPSILLTMLLIASIASGCTNEAKELKPPAGVVSYPTASAWLVYWDSESSLDDIKALEGKLDSLNYFAAYFGSDDRLFIPDSIAKLRGQVAETFGDDRWDSYLTIVNDALMEGGGSSLKDTTLLYRLLENPQERSRHADEIISLAKGEGYDGIEIDYEAIKNDMTLWSHFIDFVGEVYQKTQDAGLKLRVILEPNIAFDRLNFSEGPQYVVMCYNLHGYNSQTGPKADDEFLINIIEKTASLPGKRSFAIATGGFEWIGGRPFAITEAVAAEISARESITPQRDGASGALFFTYKSDGHEKELWYADAQTINRWASLILSRGDFDIALWRLGGNDPALWLE